MTTDLLTHAFQTDARQERADLVASLTARRRFLRLTVRDLTDQQAALRPTVSELCLGGIIKHVTRLESRWVDFILHGPGAIGPTDQASYEAHAASFRMEQGETLDDLLARYQRVADRTDRLAYSWPSLNASHPLPEAPWFEPGVSWTARQVLVHIIGETAQHAGHADVIRASIDGAKTMGWTGDRTAAPDCPVLGTARACPMDFSTFRASASVIVDVPAEDLYAFVADMPRIGEVSPECTGGWWEGEGRGVGATFIGTNTEGDRTWQRRLLVSAADPPREFAWENLGDPAQPPPDGEGGPVRWSYTFAPVAGGTEVVETWSLREHPRLVELGEQTLRIIQSRSQAGIEQTLARLQQLFKK